MSQLVHLRLDTFSLAQLKIIRRHWVKLDHAKQTCIVAGAKAKTSKTRNSHPDRFIALPENCAPLAVARFRALSETWQALNDKHRSEVLAEVIRGSGVANVK
jgi:hypothetical protein